MAGFCFATTEIKLQTIYKLQLQGSIGACSRLSVNPVGSGSRTRPLGLERLEVGPVEAEAPFFDLGRWCSQRKAAEFHEAAVRFAGGRSEPRPLEDSPDSKKVASQHNFAFLCFRGQFPFELKGKTSSETFNPEAPGFGYPEALDTPRGCLGPGLKNLAVFRALFYIELEPKWLYHFGW